MKKLFTILVSILVTASVYSQTYKVNTYYSELGGYVIKTDGTHGVVVAMQDQGAANWWNAKVAVNDTRSYYVNGAKFNDWRLPTKDELNLIFLQEESIAGLSKNAGFRDNLYWTSTEGDNDFMWVQGSGNDGYEGQLLSPKYVAMISVRGVRNF
ncbi:MAG: Uncharacterised protein [Flavobacterium sp. SCGC AAA160-P02]|nr:MAG: Uncharacterised protein [Flavobacterium sp. SCGC AAA160-P02]